MVVPKSSWRKMPCTVLGSTLILNRNCASSQSHESSVAYSRFVRLLMYVETEEGEGER
jgi:hypothetical protein